MIYNRLEALYFESEEACYIRRKNMYIIGEKLNGTIPSMAKAIANRDEEWIKDLARKEAEAGSDFIDVCASVEVGEVETLKWMIDLVQSVTDVPIAVDSPSADVLAEAYKFCKVPGMFNSVSMESSKKIDMIFKLMAENPGWQVVAMLCDDTGIPKCAADRLRVFDNIMAKAKEYGIDPSRIHIDPIIEAAALMDPDREDGPGIAINTKVISTIRQQYPTIHITSAISNISHSLPARKFMNYAFTTLVLECGLDSGILDPLNRGMIGVIKATEYLLAAPKEEFDGYVAAVKEDKLMEGAVPAIDGLSEDEAKKAFELAMTALAIQAGAEDYTAPAENRDLVGVVYAAKALLGLDEDGYCMEYIEAYRDGEFGVLK